MTIKSAELESAAHNVGQRLRQSREQLNYTQQHVAKKLCLKLDVIRYIENELSPEELLDTFMRGYIRAYAHLVKAVVHDLLPKSSSELHKLPNRQQVIKNRSLIQLFFLTYKKLLTLVLELFIVVIVIYLCGLCYKQQDSIVKYIKRFMIAKNASSFNLIKVIDKNIPKKERLVGHSSSETDKSAKDVRPDNQFSEATPIALTESIVENISIKERQLNEFCDERSKFYENIVIDSDSQPDKKASVDFAVQKDNSTNCLKLTFRDFCWLSIKDVNGKNLLYGLKSRGDTSILYGKAPYQLIIGAHKNVDIWYGGKFVDLTPYVTANGVARFTLPSSN